MCSCPRFSVQNMLTKQPEFIPSISGPFGCSLPPFWVHFGFLGGSGGRSGSHLGPKTAQSSKNIEKVTWWTPPRAQVGSQNRSWRHFLTKKTQTNRRSKSKPQKHRFPIAPDVAQCGSHTVNTICAEGSIHIHLSDFGVTLGYNLGSLLDTFGYF